MIQEKSYKATQMKNQKDEPNTRNVSSKKRTSWHAPKLFIRRGVSQKVLDAADRLMKEYQSDLDYLKDR